jgi:hypothetical protein
MKALTAVLLATVLVAPGLASAKDAPAASAKPYKAALTPSGIPDLQGVWTNASLTRLERDTKFGDRAAYTPQETAALEGDRKALVAVQAAPTDPNASTAQINGSCEVKGYTGGPACGYNGAWTDPGDTVMRVAGQPRTSFITFPANGRIPARVAGAPDPGPRRGGGEGSREANRPGQNDNPEGRSIAERCIFMPTNSGPVLQSSLYNNNYQFVQSKDSIAINIEMAHEVRVIRLNAKHRTDGVRPYTGDSIGHFEGDTLVVETTNFSPQQNFRGSSEHLKVTEHFTRVGKDRLLYQFKVEDPTVWKEAWGGEYEFLPAAGLVYEYACHEGNYGLQNILAGAREEERQALAASKAQAAR